MYQDLLAAGRMRHCPGVRAPRPPYPGEVKVGSHLHPAKSYDAEGGGPAFINRLYSPALKGFHKLTAS